MMTSASTWHPAGEVKTGNASSTSPLTSMPATTVQSSRPLTQEAIIRPIFPLQPDSTILFI